MLKYLFSNCAGKQQHSKTVISASSEENNFFQKLPQAVFERSCFPLSPPPQAGIQPYEKLG